MLHRLRVPDDLVDRVLALLTDEATVTNVAVVPHGFRKPPGTMVLADIARENASGVVSSLNDLDLQHSGSITVDEVDTVLSDEAVRVEKAAPGAPDDGVVWVQVENRLRSDARFSWVFLGFMTPAALIAGAGRILDQPILIVGAMVVGPEFTPVAALCFALARPRLSMLPPALRTLVLGYLSAIGVATAIWTVAYEFGAFTRHQASSGTLTDFIVSPDAWSFVVACLAGIAGTLALTTATSGPLVGVFISITTIPAAGTIAVCVAAGVWSEVGSALAQLGVNLLGLVIAGTVTLLVQRVIWHRVAPGHGAMTR